MIGLATSSWLADEPLLHVCGELDLDTTPRLEQALAEAFDGGAKRVTLDLTACEFLDSTALNALLAAEQTFGPVSIVTPDRTIRKVLEMMGLDRLFSVYSTLDEALQGPARV
jgi:anti-sigma B factor antagonist